MYEGVFSLGLNGNEKRVCVILVLVRFVLIYGKSFFSFGMFFIFLFFKIGVCGSLFFLD